MKRKRRPNDALKTVRAIYRKLSQAWGPQHWWPAESPFEVILGAILTQNTSWTNVEKAIANLRAAGVLSVAGIRELAAPELEELIRPSGYFRQKTARLKGLVGFLDERYGGAVEALLATPTAELRETLLALKGIGPETADSILLYAGHHPIFVVDAYTRRVLERHDAVALRADYDEVRNLVEQALQGEEAADWSGLKLKTERPAVHPPSAMSTAKRTTQVQVFNEMHGLLVQLGKHYCTKQAAKCESCPLGEMLTHPVHTASKTRRGSERRPAKSRV